MPRADSSPTSRILALAAVVIVVAALYLAREVLIPLALAVLLTFLLTPVVSLMERARIPRIAGVVVAVAVLFLLLGLLAWVVARQVRDLANNLPQYRSNIEGRIHAVRNHLGGPFRQFRQTASQISQNLDKPPAGERVQTVRLAEPPGSALQTITSASGPIVSVAMSMVIVLIFVIFMLVQRESLRDRIIRLIGHGRLNMTTQALDEAGRRVSRYLLMQSLINAAYGLAIGLGLLATGLPNAALFGLLAGLLRFIPYLGPWLGAVLPVGLSLAAGSDWLHPLAVVGLFLVAELVASNVLEPLLYGASAGVTPVAILVAAVFWTWLWGGIGLLLSTPLTVCVAVMSKYIPQLRFLHILLTDEQVLDEPTRVYQRLLAADAEEATELAEARFQELGPLAAFDQILLPVLSMTEEDYHGGQLDEGKRRFIFDTVRDWISELPGLPAGPEALTLAELANGSAAANGGKALALCLPAHDEADELAALMLAQVLRAEGIPARHTAIRSLASEVGDIVAQVRPNLVCISALPPSALTYTRYLCKRLRQRQPDVPQVVGLWRARGDMESVRRRMRCGPGDRLATSLAEARAEIITALQPAMAGASRPDHQPAP